MENQNKLKAMINLASSHPSVIASANQFNTDKWLLNCLNGTLDLKTGVLRNHSAADLITKFSPVYYSEEEAPLWEEFLHQVMAGDEEKIKYLQKAVGYSLTAETYEQCFFILHGNGANGKSTFLETIKYVLGDYAKATDIKTFLQKKNDASNDLAALAGSRFVIASEAPKGRKFNEAILKQITGNDTLNVRFLFNEFFEFEPHFKLFIATNDKPRIQDSSHAMWRRVKLIPFEVTITSEEQDKQLLSKLKGEASGILTWALEGCQLWQAEDLGDVPGITSSTEEYRQEMDTIGQFLKIYESLMKSGVRSGEWYQQYKNWCADSGVKARSIKQFANTLAQRGYTKKRTKDGNFWYGSLSR